MQRGEARDAIDLYEEAHLADARPEYLREIGRLYDALAHAGDPRDVRLAIVYLERFLHEDEHAADRAEIEARLLRLRRWRFSFRPEFQVPPRPMVSVHLTPYEPGLRYEVALAGQGCTTPCTVLVPPGPALLRARGAGDVTIEVAVPPRPIEIRVRHTDRTANELGTALVSTGVLVGGGMWTLSYACRPGDESCRLANLAIWPSAGLLAVAVGIAIVASGAGDPPRDANQVTLISGREGRPLVSASVRGSMLALSF